MEHSLRKSIERRKNHWQKITSISIILYILLPLFALLLAFHSNTVSAKETDLRKANLYPEINKPLLSPSFHLVGSSYPFGLNLVTIVNGVDAELSLLTHLSSISEILLSHSIVIRDNDIVSPSSETVIANGAKIVITRVDKEVELVQVSVPFKTVIQNDPNIDYGQEVVLSEGVMGAMIERYQLTYENGVLAERVLASTEITQDVTNEIVARGTKLVMTQNASCQYWDSVIDSTTSDIGARNWLKYLMRCESGCNNRAVSQGNLYHGLFQYLPATFRNNGGKDIYDGHQQIPLALRVYFAGKKVQEQQFGHCAKQYNSSL